jgi:hypothetical protein
MKYVFAAFPGVTDFEIEPLSVVFGSIVGLQNQLIFIFVKLNSFLEVT